jgi:hypothetical protein
MNIKEFQGDGDILYAPDPWKLDICDKLFNIFQLINFNFKYSTAIANGSTAQFQPWPLSRHFLSCLDSRL